MNRISLKDLPIEILIKILSFTDPITLKIIPLVCKKWFIILNDNTVWKEIFRIRFQYHLKKFSSISRSTSWKNELIQREKLFNLYYKQKRTNSGFLIKNLIGNLNIVKIDINWPKNTLICWDIGIGNVFQCNFRNGKKFIEKNDWIPEGVTSYDIGKKILIFGKWDGKVAGGLINFKGLLINNFKVWENIENGARISSVCVSPNEVNKAGSIGAFSGDENGKICCWDVRMGKILFQINFKIKKKIIFLKTDGKSVIIIILNDGGIFLVKNIFKFGETGIKVFKIGEVKINDESNNFLLKKIDIDYGGCNILVYDSNELVIFQYNNEAKLIQYSIDFEKNNEVDNESGDDIKYNFENYRNLKLPENDSICKIEIEQNENYLTNVDENIVGNDPLFLAVAFKSGKVFIINIREEVFEIEPLNIIIPHFLNEFDDETDLIAPPISSMAINSLVLLVSNFDGKVEMYDVMTGKFLRNVLEKLNRNKINELQYFNRDSSILKIDQNSCRGLLIIGPYIQYFRFGDDGDYDEQKQKNKKLAKEKKFALNEVKTNLDDYNYQVEEENKKIELFERYNGTSLEDENDELQVAMALSMSVNNDNEMDDLTRALELSLNEEGNELNELDEEMRMAIELSQIEQEEEEWQKLI